MIADATIGENSRIGPGVVTCNTDGENEFHTVIGRDVKIGADTLLVAPVRIGNGASTGAGSVVTQDVPPNTLVYGAPAHSKQEQETGA